VQRKQEEKMNPTTQLTPAEYHALLRLDFYAFIQRCFLQLNPSQHFLPNWHIEVIAAKLEACRQGKIRRLIINVPPRHLKSICASIALVAWILGHDPSAQVLCVSYAQDLADKLARDCRSVLTSKWFRALFGDLISTNRQSVQEFKTKCEGCRRATSIGGVLTGFGADFIMIDDPLKPDEALSDGQRNGVNEWYDNTLYSRLNNKDEGCIILIMQRLHEDDLVGHVLEQEQWEVVSLPAIAEQDESFLIETPYGPRRFTRTAGGILHPARESRRTLTNIRRTIGEYNFAGQYQQAPAPAGGGLINKEWFKTYGSDDRGDSFDQIVQSWDTANKVSELNAYSVCTTWGIKGSRIYLLHVLRRRMEYPDLKRAVISQARIYGATVVLIEDQASGTQLIQELIRDGLHSVRKYKPEHDKVMRLRAQTATIENGFVFLPREAPWLADYLHELITFPNAKHCDQADSTSQALAWINLAPGEPGIITFFRQEAARKKHREGVPVNRIAAEAGTTPEEVQGWLSPRPAPELTEARASHGALQKIRERCPGISTQELHRYLRAAGFCVFCGGSLMLRRAFSDARGPACHECAQKNGITF
jgi:predicted phage terminase large subunit-like protein